jgi:hypothetical protein
MLLPWESISFLGYVFFYVDTSSLYSTVCFAGVAPTDSSIFNRSFGPNSSRFYPRSFEETTMHCHVSGRRGHPHGTKAVLRTTPGMFHRFTTAKYCLTVIRPGHGAESTTTNIHLIFVYWRKRTRIGVLFQVLLKARVTHSYSSQLDRCFIFSSPRKSIPPSLYSTRS